MTTLPVPLVSPVPRARRRVRVRGVVQGVGYRPFVFRVATEEHVDGFVGNDTDGVFAEVEGAPAALEVLVRRLYDDAPPLARVDSVEWDDVPITRAVGFHIVASRRARDAHQGITFVSPDAAVCDDCLRELFDPHDRRFRYPFVNCTNCGPRFTITTSLPYDRANTTMTGFTLCPACRREYDDPADRRHHAEPLACPACGPHLEYDDAWSTVTGTDAVLTAAHHALLDSRIVAVKGVGGYHLACDAADDAAVARLRERKHRPAKAFAVMARDLDVACRLAQFDDAAVALLTSVARPVVLALRRTGIAVSAAVAPANPLLGVMLPSNPLHHLLFASVPGSRLDPPDVLVMTSGNMSDEPICHVDADARARLHGIVDAWVVHDRPIHMPCDDSVVRVVDGVEQPVRRSRGHSPAPIPLPRECDPILAVGGDLKNAFCLATGRVAWMSQHLGDMGNLETLQAFERSTEQFSALYRVEPEVLVADLHPGYVTRRWAERRQADVFGVQHHHAHAAALMTEHGLPPDAAILACTFDGTGYGTDGTVWGGEILLARYDGFERVAHLRTVAVPGGDAGVRAPARVALAHLRAAGIRWSDDVASVRALEPDARSVLDRQLALGTACAPTSSAGRLFDAVSSLLGIRHHASYEGQAAMELEAAARSADDDGPPLGFAIDDGVLDPAPLLHDLVARYASGCPVPTLARAFHGALAAAIVDVATGVRDTTGIGTIGLTGGVFQNVLLTTLTRRSLVARGFDVLVHRRVPPNDGGLALGQVAVAAAQTTGAAV
jgi:hydrogenase maturation protein HypF